MEEISWQEKSRTHRERLSHLLETGINSDVTFIVGISPVCKTYKLHKVILSMCSDVFFTMLYGSLPELGEIEVPDISPRIFDITVKYMYEESLTVESMEEAVHTYYTADKYNIKQLRILCVEYIAHNLCLENIFLLLETPYLLEELEIKSKCESFLSLHTSDILKSENFLKLPSEMVKYIIQLDELNVDNEEALFEYILSWAKEAKRTKFPQEELRTIMNHFLPHIKFLAMTVEGFLSGPGNSGVLSDSEIAHIASNIVTPGHRELPSWCCKEYSKRNKPIIRKVSPPSPPIVTPSYPELSPWSRKKYSKRNKPISCTADWGHG